MTPLAVLLLAACHARRPASEAPAAAPTGAESPAEQLRVMIGPGRWTSGAEVTVPAGWTARSEPPAAVRLTDPLTRAVLHVYVDQALPSERTGYLRVFADEDRYRRVPVIEGGGAETWVSRDPFGPTVLVWFGDGLRVELEAPMHTLFSALERFEPVLADLGR